jgi:Mitochondrial carrier protein
MIAQHSKLAAGQLSPSRAAMGNWDVIRYCIQNHGISSMWRGMTLTVARDGLGVGCFFYAMTWTERQLTPPGQTPTVASTLISGAVAGLAYWVSSLPLDTIKTWQQSADLTGSTRFSVTDSIQKIYLETGHIGLAQRLMRGWQVAYFRGMPSAAITYSVYSFAYRRLQHTG